MSEAGTDSEDDGLLDRVKAPTLDDIKAVAQNYSPENIPALAMPAYGWEGFGAIGACSFLAHLDLSGNRIGGDLVALAPLKYLSTLDLSFNSIESVHGVQALAELKTLELSGNRIASLTHEALTELSQLHQLTRLSLCDVAEAAPNPVCKVPGYQDRLMAAVPSLLTLNGRRTNVAEDDDFYKGADSLDKVLITIETELSAKIDASGGRTLSAIGSALTEDAADADLSPMTKEFDAMLSTCQQDLNRAQLMMGPSQEPEPGPKDAFLTTAALEAETRP
jgi:hypothetical protein